MVKKSYANQEGETITYAHASAVTVGDVINIANIGIGIAAGTYDAGVAGIYYLDGEFVFPIASGVTIVQGNKCYWDLSAKNVIITGAIAEDYELGRATANGSAVGGYVTIHIGASPADYRTAGGLTAQKIAFLAGTLTTTNSAVEVVTDVRISSTDFAMTCMSSITSDNLNVSKIVVNDGSVSLTMSAASTGSKINYQISK